MGLPPAAVNIDFPHKERLRDIVNAHFPSVSTTLVESAVERFVTLREEMYSAKGRAGKKVSTSELLDWVNVLRRNPEDAILKQLKGRLPFASVLLKSWKDHLDYVKEQPTEGR